MSLFNKKYYLTGLIICFAVICSSDAMKHNTTIESLPTCALSAGEDVHQPTHDDESRRVHTERYPAIFPSYLQHTTEKDVEGEYVVRASKLVSSVMPSWLHKQPVMYDIGCGEGYLSSLVLKGIQPIVPGELCYFALDPQETLLRDTQQALKDMSWLKPSFVAQKFEQFVPDSEQYPVADMVLMAQCCYYMKDIPRCIEIMKKLMSPNGYAFLIHVKGSKVHSIREKYSTIVASRARGILDIIEAALTKSGLHYAAVELPITVYFPKLSDEAWQHLFNVPYRRYDVDYTVYGEEFVWMKHLCELFFDYPLEGFAPEHRKLLLEELRKILIEDNYTLTVYHRMHVVTAGALPEQLVSALSSLDIKK